MVIALPSQKELARLRRENARMKDALIEYYRTETDYEMRPSVQRYGRYQDACRQLVAIAKEVAEQRGKERTK